MFVAMAQHDALAFGDRGKCGQHGTIGSIANGMDIGLETGRRSSDDNAPQIAFFKEWQALVTRRIAVIIDHPGPTRSKRAIGLQFHRHHCQTIIIAPANRAIGSNGDAIIRAIRHGIKPRCQLAARRKAAIAVPCRPVDAGIMGAGEADRSHDGEGFFKGSVVFRGRQGWHHGCDKLHRPIDKNTIGVATGIALDPSTRRIGRGGGDVGQLQSG